MMKGVIGLKFWPDYSLTRTPEGRGFLSRWRQQSSTQGSNGRCDLTLDDSGYTYLYAAEIYPNNYLCTGLSFSSYRSDGSDLSK